MSNNIDELTAIIEQIKDLAKRYHTLTGKPLGVTGEIGEYTAAKLLGLTLEGARQPGYDAVRQVDDTRVRIQIKSRVLDPSSSGGRVGSIKLDKPEEWLPVAQTNKYLGVPPSLHSFGASTWGKV